MFVGVCLFGVVLLVTQARADYTWTSKFTEITLGCGSSFAPRSIRLTAQNCFA